MAELGHPTIGPQSYWKLTPGEIRIYAEGMSHRQSRHQQATHEVSHQYDRESFERREQDALERMTEQVHEHRGQQSAAV